MRLPRDRVLLNCRRLDEALPGGGPLAAMEPNAVTADKAVDGVLAFRHLGTQWTCVGRTDIDWSGPAHDHQEWAAQLNRFFYMPPLAAAWQQTGLPHYAEAARDYMADWLRVHPVGEGWRMPAYDNTLNLSIRMLQWFTALPVLIGSPAFDDAVVDAMLESACAQLDFLSDHLSSQTNWRIAQADSLVTTGLRLDGLAEATRWRTFGIDVLNDAFRRQVLPDGAHTERNPSYHVWMTGVFEKYWRLARAMPELGLVMTVEPIARMHDYALGSTRPNGAMNAMHDSVGRRSGSEPNEARTARVAFRRDAGLPDELPPESQFFPDAGQALLRDGWGEDATYVTFDATTWGGAHCHLSRNTVQLHAAGRSLVVDPGYLTYEASDPFCAYGRSTRAHSTVNVNGLSQCEADPDSRFLALPGYDLVASCYDGGYWDGEYTWRFRPSHGDGLFAWHHRTMLWVRGRFTAVLDQVWHDYGERPVFIECNWQLCEGGVELGPDGARARTCHDDSNVLLLFPLRPGGSTLQLHEGERDPLRGWLPGQGACVPAPQVCLLVDPAPAGSTDVATVLVPFGGRCAPQVVAEGSGGNGVNRLELSWDDGSTDEILWTGCLARAVDAQADLATDGSLVHLTRQADGRISQGLVVDGTFIRPFAPEVRAAAETFTFRQGAGE